ncbi:MAG: aspartyl/glutamyl-tRNA amidotransferase subunit C [Candidatus Ryanbacteria bacterium]|nr:aspartyl/glutamyl-tRNA amidotransferase subunit C [Candidatus Ryanbacteria bacterium]
MITDSEMYGRSFMGVGVKHLFDLARIDASEEELAKFPKELDAILEYVAMLKKAPLDGLPPTLSFAPDTKELRRDEVSALDAADIAFLKKSFPEREMDYLKTKKVFGD